MPTSDRRPGDINRNQAKDCLPKPRHRVQIISGKFGMWSVPTPLPTKVLGIIADSDRCLSALSAIIPKAFVDTAMV